jgi:hypothetical protein
MTCTQSSDGAALPRHKVLFSFVAIPHYQESERSQTHLVDRSATGTGTRNLTHRPYFGKVHNTQNSFERGANRWLSVAYGRRRISPACLG